MIYFQTKFYHVTDVASQMSLSHTLSLILRTKGRQSQLQLHSIWSPKMVKGMYASMTCMQVQVTPWHTDCLSYCNLSCC